MLDNQSADQLPPNANDGTLEGAVAAIPDNLISFEEAARREDAASPFAEAAQRQPQARDPVTQRFTKDQPQPQQQQPVDPVQQPPIDAQPEAAESAVDEEMFELPPDRDGEEPRRIPAREVFEGYQKAQELAAELEQARRVAPPPVEWDRQLYENVQVRNKLVQQLEALEHVMMPSEPDLRLLDPNNPYHDTQAFYQQKTAYDAAMAKIAQLKQARAHEEAQISRERAALTKAASQREQGKLLEFWPEIRQPVTQRQVYADMAKHYGYTQDEINSIMDSRQYAVMKDALAWRASQNQRQAAVKVVRSVPKLVKAPARSTQTRTQQNTASAMRRLSQSHSVEDAADVIGGLLG